MEQTIISPAEKKPVRKNVYYLFAFCLGLIIMSTQVSIPFVGYIVALVSVILAIVGTKEETFLFVLGLSPLYRLASVNIGPSSMTFLMFVLLVIALKRYFIEKKPMTLSVFCLIFLFVLDVVNTRNFSHKQYATSIMWILSLMYFMFIMTDDVKFNLHNVILFFCLGVWAECLIGIIEEYSVLGRTLDPTMYGRYLSLPQAAAFQFGSKTSTMHRFGFATNLFASANTLAFDTIFGVCLCVFGLTAKRKKFFSFYVITIVSFTYFGFITLSRGFYVELLILFVLFLFSQNKSFNQFLSTLLFSIVIISVFAIFFMDDLSLVFEKTGERFAHGNETRESLWSISLEVLFSNDGILFTGLSSMYPYEYAGFTAHNMILDSFLSFGVAGCLIYYSCIASTFKTYEMKNFKRHLYNYTPIIILVSYRMISGSVRDVAFYFALTVAALMMRYNKEEESELACVTSL